MRRCSRVCFMLGGRDGVGNGGYDTSDGIEREG